MRINFAYWTVALTGGLAGTLGCNATTGDQPAVAKERHVRPPILSRPHVANPRSLGVVVHAPPMAEMAPIAGAEVDARALVITAQGTDAAFTAITSTLQYLGAPYDVLNATSGPALTADSLATGAHGKYDAVFLDLGGLQVSGGSAFTTDEWTALQNYEAAFNVRRVSLYTSPSAMYDLADNGQIDPTQTPVTLTCTGAAGPVFVGTNCANPIVMTDGWVYPATVTATADTVTPLLVDASGNVYGVVVNYADGREALALTFAQAPYLTPYLQLAYGLVSWATRGLFVGERHVYAVPQIDDFFLASAIYTGGTYRITDADLQSLADWQNLTRTQPLTAGFRLAWAVNGQGSQSMPGDPLTAKALVLGPTFSWINHSWDHPILDGLSYSDVLTEFTRNDTFIRGLGLMPYATANVVTPSISGLASADAMQAIHDVGIRQLVSDTSEPGQNNPSPNAGLWNALQPSVLEIPRIPTNLDYDVSQPSEWIPEYEATVTGGAAVDYPTMIDKTSDDLLQDLLCGNNDPWMFHQANTRDYDGAGHSLLSELLTATFGKYTAAATFPIVSPTMDDLATRVTNRMTFNASGVVATIQPQTSVTISVTAAATVPVTGLCIPGAESYGGQTISYLPLAAGQSVTLSLTTCNPNYSGSGGASGASGSPGGSGAGGIGAAGTSGSLGGNDGSGGMTGNGISGAAGSDVNADGGATGGSGGGATGGGETGIGGATGEAGSSGGVGAGGMSGVTGAGGGSESGAGGQAGQGSKDAGAPGTDSGSGAGQAGGSGAAAGAAGGAGDTGAGCNCGVSGGRPRGGVLLLGLLGLVGARRTRRR
ncbi:MAG TPA: hypothetical protein VLA79_10195 [Polyangia bacterium]|nr:hypothetical protein [Polyangia bacterium]